MFHLRVAVGHKKRTTIMTVEPEKPACRQNITPEADVQRPGPTEKPQSLIANPQPPNYNVSSSGGR
jgi:hypothetical protein